MLFKLDLWERKFFKNVKSYLSIFSSSYQSEDRSQDL